MHADTTLPVLVEVYETQSVNPTVQKIPSSIAIPNRIRSKGNQSPILDRQVPLTVILNLVVVLDRLYHEEKPGQHTAFPFEQNKAFSSLALSHNIRNTRKPEYTHHCVGLGSTEGLSWSSWVAGRISKLLH